MYGGHITDNIDRRLESTYLQEYLRPEMLDQDLELAPGFPGPPPSDFVEYHAYIDDVLPSESPNLCVVGTRAILTLNFAGERLEPLRAALRILSVIF